MKNPFKKADSAKLPEQGRERTEIDYAHRTIIHHMLYGYPGDFSSCARYQHHASALNLQADLRLQVENLRASKKLIEEQLADVNARIQKLEA